MRMENHFGLLSSNRLSFQSTIRRRSLSLSERPSQNRSLNRCQPSDESAGLHFASCRLSCVVLGRRWGEVVLRGAVASESITGGDMQETCQGCSA